jgi:NodT family efflux transporter outer membrane factor (OMF) lipoprotein
MSPDHRVVFRWSGVIALALASASCISTRDIQPQNQAVDANQLAMKDSVASAQVAQDTWPVDEWWHAFHDPQLDDLVDRTLAGNPSLQIAKARIDQARAEALSIAGNRKLQGALNLSTTTQRYSGNDLFPPPLGGSTETEARFAFDFSYELDFWGRWAQASRAANIRVNAARAELAQARLMLAVSVVRTYLNFAFQNQALGVAQENLSQKQHTLDLTRSRYSSGLDSSVQLKQAESAVATAQFGVEYSLQGLDSLRQQLAALTAQGPDAGLHLNAPPSLEIAMPALPSTLPLDLIARRPEIQVLRLEIEAAEHDLKSARADAYPNVNLAAFAGVQSLGLGDLLKSSSRTYGVGPAIHLPIFDGDRVRAGVLRASGTLDETIGQYNDAILQAVRDVAQQVSALRYLVRQREQQRIAQDAAEEAYRLAELRYKEGIDNYLTLISAQSSLLTQHFLAAYLDSQERSIAVELIRALGGGYDPQHPAT